MSTPINTLPLAPSGVSGLSGKTGVYDIVVTNHEHVRNLVKFRGTNSLAELVVRFHEIDAHAVIASICLQGAPL